MIKHNAYELRPGKMNNYAARAAAKVFISYAPRARARVPDVISCKADVNSIRPSSVLPFAAGQKVQSS